MVRYSSRIGSAGGLPVVKRAVKKVKKARAKRAAPVASVEPEEKLEVPVDPTLEGVGGALRTGGALVTGGALGTGGALVDGMSYPDAIHMLGAMSNQDYHTLQGLASMFLPSAVHPMKRPLMSMIGGAFKHPADISKVATNDILRAPNPMFLSKILHSEWLDHAKGLPTGGGLFSSIKNALKKGVQGLAKGAKIAVGIGKRLVGAINTGKQIAKSFQGPLAAISPGAAELVGRGLKAAEGVQRGIGLGLGVAGPVAEGLGRVSAAVQ